MKEASWYFSLALVAATVAVVVLDGYEASAWHAVDMGGVMTGALLWLIAFAQIVPFCVYIAVAASSRSEERWSVALSIFVGFAMFLPLPIVFIGYYAGLSAMFR